MTTRRDTWHGTNWSRREKRLAIYMRDNWHCVYCDKDLEFVHNARERQLDHVKPILNSTPDNRATNLVTACKLCNGRKNGKTLETFLKGDQEKIDHVLAQLAKPIDVQAAKVILYGED